MKGMYGLPQAANKAQKKLREAMVKDGALLRTTADDCIYMTKGTKVGEASYAALEAHVDDIICIGKGNGVKLVEELLKSKFEITTKTNPNVITGVQVERNREKKWLELHLTEYTTEMLTKHGMMDCKIATAPVDPGMARTLMLLPIDEQIDPSVVLAFHCLMGELIWLMVKTRPDMAFVVNLFSRFLKNATLSHFKLLKGRPLRYVRGTTIDHGIVFYPGMDEWRLRGAGDADLGRYLASSRPTFGYTSNLGKFGALVCRSALERKICTSTGHQKLMQQEL
jgi:hypothetical protein